MVLLVAGLLQTGCTCAHGTAAVLLCLQASAECSLVLEGVADAHYIGWLFVRTSGRWQVADVPESCKRKKNTQQCAVVRSPGPHCLQYTQHNLGSQCRPGPRHVPQHHQPWCYGSSWPSALTCKHPASKALLHLSNQPADAPQKFHVRVLLLLLLLLLLQLELGSHGTFPDL
ncbi:hypothetical protein COO60DRAFT_88387 [Scenedesmus sp. NREL 46B-D3]|nr:hypothetical protein COO60DRAFT_88387 [Scenedesmus sp. NREL 46B-D3]